MRKKTMQEYIKELNEIGNKCVPLEEYINTNTPIKHRCPNCGNEEWYVRPRDILKRNLNKCCKCYKNKQKTNEEFLIEIEGLVGNEYTFLEEYTKANKKILVRHNKCGYEYKVSPHQFLNNHTRCPKCSPNCKNNTENFKKFIKDNEGDNYTLLSEYKNNRNHVLIRHNECGYEYKVSPRNFISGKRCPKCSMSKGEDMILKILSKNNKQFETQYRIDDCRKVKPLPFDFAIFDNNKLIYLIEFDGIQHFKPVKMFDGEEGFKETKIRDNIKNEYCKNNNIPLLRIPYTQINNIEDVLKKYSII